MALDYYLTIDGLNGGSTLVGHVGAFAVVNYSFDVDNLVSVVDGRLQAGPANFSPLTVDLASNAELTALLGDLANGAHIPSIELQGVQSGLSGGKTAYDLVLNDVVVTKYHDDNSSGDGGTSVV